MKKIITIKGLNKTFKDVEVLKDLDISINAGEFIAIMGSSGSGKSTLLNIASGLLKPTSGLVEINGTDISKLKEPKLTKFRARNLSFIFQSYSLIEYLTVIENIKFTAKISGYKIDSDKLKSIIKVVDLEEQIKKLPSMISGGQQQRVAIARSLISESKILFADEPTGALDIASRSKILKLLKSACEDFGKTIIMVTHDPEAAAYADKVLFLSEGSLDVTLENANSKEIANQLIHLEGHDA